MTGPTPVLPAEPLTRRTVLPVTEDGGIVGWEEDYGRLRRLVRRLTLVGAVVGAVVFAGLLLLFLPPVMEVVPVSGCHGQTPGGDRFRRLRLRGDPLPY